MRDWFCLGLATIFLLGVAALALSVVLLPFALLKEILQGLLS